jgi:hypothetical protein
MVLTTAICVDVTFPTHQKYAKTLKISETVMIRCLKPLMKSLSTPTCL